MTPNELLREMFVLQQQLNDETNGKGWENGYTKNNKLINWKRCIYMEAAELLDSFSWKHWKNIDKDTDWDNVRVEIVDIWHFVMSLLLEDYKVNGKGDIEALIAEVAESQGFNDFCKEPYDSSAFDSLELVNEIEAMIHMTSGFKLDLFDDLLKEYFDLSLKCGVNLSELYRFYIAKNVLNRFRQNHGYKEGCYVKKWDGKEDNEVMIEILNEGVQGIDAIYDALKARYKVAARQ